MNPVNPVKKEKGRIAMKIELHRIKVRDLVDGYVDDAESGVWGCRGLLDIRPAYQREFVYKEKERNAVISTVMKGFPLNVMYWAKNPDGTFEVMDGQQRTISICQYANGDFAWGELDLAAKYFHRQPEDEQRKFREESKKAFARFGGYATVSATSQRICIPTVCHFAGCGGCCALIYGKITMCPGKQ